MYTVKVLNLKTNNTFEKIFEDPYLMEKFINKCKYSKKVKVISYIKNY